MYVLSNAIITYGHAPAEWRTLKGSNPFPRQAV